MLYAIRQIFLKGGTIKDAIAYVVKQTGNMPTKSEGMKIINMYQDIQKDTAKIFQFPKDRITPFHKPRPGDPNYADSVIKDLKSRDPVDAMKEANSIIGRKNPSYKGPYKNLSDDEAQRILKETDDHIFQRDIKYDEFGDPIKPEDMASGGIAGQLHLNEGGRAGFKEGSGMKRRTFLKILGGLGALPIVGKYLKWAKPLAKAKSLTSVPITQTANMPDWFIPLINKVIKEGDNLSDGPALDFMGRLKKKGPVYKRDVTNLEEGKIVHTKKLPGGEEVKVTQNINEGSVTVDYKTSNSMAEDGVTLTYREGSELVPHPTIPNAMTTKYRSKKEPPTFNAAESFPEAHGVGPEDVEMTFEGTNDALKVDDLFSDTSKLKQFATGKKLTKQELKIAKEKTDKVAKINERPEDVLPDYDWDDVVDPSDYAKGGRVSYTKGGLAHVLGV